MRNLPLFITLIALAACSSAPPQREVLALPPAPEPREALVRGPVDPVQADGGLNDMVMYAISLAETPYRYGGQSMESGFDCSGFVGHVYRKSVKLELPRTSREISQVGLALPREQLRAGDLVFFNTRKKAYSHVGIYVGEDKFVHAPRTGARIRVDSMKEKYWVSRYNGARRVYF